MSAGGQKIQKEQDRMDVGGDMNNIWRHLGHVKVEDRVEDRTTVGSGNFFLESSYTVVTLRLHTLMLS